MESRYKQEKAKLLLSILIGALICIFLWKVLMHEDNNKKETERIYYDPRLESRSSDLAAFLKQQQQHQDSNINHPASNNDLKRRRTTKQVRILCWTLTDTSNKENRARVQAIRETWGKRCDKILFVKVGKEFSETGDTLTVPLEHEARDKLWNKNSLAIEHIYSRYLHVFDWFMKTDDDTYVVMENLRKFLNINSSPERAIYYGCKFKPYVHQGYMSGGSGYVLSRRALRLLVEDGFNNKTNNCNSQATVENEDIEMGRCLELVKVEAGDTRDSQGRQRFLPLSPQTLLFQREGKSDPDFWYDRYLFYNQPSGAQFNNKSCCSDQPISFHYIEPEIMYLIDWLLYNVNSLKPSDSIEDDLKPR